jgi:hypothetical protein
MRLYQDQHFEVTELKGKKLQTYLICKDIDYPYDVLMICILTKGNECYRCFLDAGISFIEKLENLEDDNELIYEDITAKYQLKDKEIKRVYSKCDGENSKIIFEIGTHKFILQCVDPSHFDDENKVFKVKK